MKPRKKIYVYGGVTSYKNMNGYCKKCKTYHDIPTGEWAIIASGRKYVLQCKESLSDHEKKMIEERQNNTQ